MSPFTDTRNDAESWIYSGGFGFRTGKAYFDMSFSHATRTDVYGMYSPTPGSNEVVLNDIKANNLLFTIGFKF